MRLGVAVGNRERKQEIFQRREVWEEIERLKHNPNASAVQKKAGFVEGDLLLVDCYRAGVGCFKPGNDAQERRLPPQKALSTQAIAVYQRTLRHPKERGGNRKSGKLC